MGCSGTPAEVPVETIAGERATGLTMADQHALFGTGGSVKDWNNYKVFESTRGSHWGHKFLGAG